MPDLAAPPTAPVQLSALLARRDLGLRQVAGPPAGDGGGAAVHWVHTSEMADPYPYLLGGELLLTAGVQLADDPDRYAARIVAAGGAALGFGLAPVYDTVPDALAAACDRHGLPLVEVPTRTPFTAVARAVWGLMAEARHHELRRVSQAQQGLAAAAARPDPVPAVLRQLATRLGGRAVLLAPDGTALQAAGREPEPGAREAREALAALARVVRPGAGAPGAGTPGAQPPPSPTPGAGPAGPRPAPTSATDTAGSAHLAAYAVAGGEGLVLGVATTSREPGDHTIAGVAVVLLSLLTAPRQGADEAARSSALVRLLLGAAPADVAALLGEGPWTVVHAQGTGAPPALGSPLVDTSADTVRILLPADREVTRHPGWTLGLSAPAALRDLPAADAQAGRALRHAKATRTPLSRHGTTGLAALLDPTEAAAHARTLLAPLGDPPPPALLETLRTWLALHGSWDRTAVALAIHRNTVRQRIGRCATLLGSDLDDMDVRTELWFALRRG
ncbi:PucR family transcriptional regulator ligand-binding domain-containing protein [Streptomyces sp. NBC_01020]|uniref:PucR family transcriptional regulator n=1 Tax=Streptomyces sp. NBC_01020 TaxID=2903722 RepID=UPI00386E16D0|nr:PucR family transcriptional regulator ligand-binding domain-containing protein [Streptomyces sp. NBC_01020]